MDSSFKKVVARRRSSKFGFKPGAGLPDEDLVSIVDAGRLAATGGNMQPWEFIVVTDPEILSRLKSCKPHTTAVIVLAYDMEKHLPDGRNYFIEDLSAATQNILLAIESLHYGGCWVQGGLDIDNVVEVLNIPERYHVFNMVCIGRESLDDTRRDKRPLKEVIHWQGF